MDILNSPATTDLDSFPEQTDVPKIQFFVRLKQAEDKMRSSLNLYFSGKDKAENLQRDEFHLTFPQDIMQCSPQEIRNAAERISKSDFFDQTGSNPEPLSERTNFRNNIVDLLLQIANLKEEIDQVRNELGDYNWTDYCKERYLDGILKYLKGRYKKAMISKDDGPTL